jgi:regulator of sigma E protease
MHSLFFFIVAIAILVVVHEFGHFWVARRCGVKVLTFSVGFGPVLWSRKAADGTEYAISAIPLGGFVKMLDEREAAVAPEELSYAFNRKPLLARVAIVLAGPLANLIFAFFAYWLVFMIGISGFKPVVGGIVTDSIAAHAGLQMGDEITAINSEQTLIWNQVAKQLFLMAEEGGEVELDFHRGTSSYATNFTLPSIKLEKSTNVLTEIGIEPERPVIKPIIGKVVANSAAQKSGLQAADELISANGERLDRWRSWIELIQNSAGKQIRVEYQRANATNFVVLTPDTNEKGQGFIGIVVDHKATDVPKSFIAKVKFSPVEAAKKAIVETVQFSWLTITGIWGMLTGTISLDNIGGPISIAEIAGASAENGLISFLQVLAIISISLGVLNLLPIPVLDGGHLVFYLIEAIKGSPLSAEAQANAQQVGMFMIFSLMFLAFFNDLTRLFG